MGIYYAKVGNTINWRWRRSIYHFNCKYFYIANINNVDIIITAESREEVKNAFAKVKQLAMAIYERFNRALQSTTRLFNQSSMAVQREGMVIINFIKEIGNSNTDMIQQCQAFIRKI